MLMSARKINKLGENGLAPHSPLISPIWAGSRWCIRAGFSGRDGQSRSWDRAWTWQVGLVTEHSLEQGLDRRCFALGMEQILEQGLRGHHACLSVEQSLEPGLRHGLEQGPGYGFRGHVVLREAALLATI